MAKDLLDEGHMIKQSCIALYKRQKSGTVPRPHLQYFYLVSIVMILNYGEVDQNHLKKYLMK